jgi:SAM-dependent methyltransferase
MKEVSHMCSERAGKDWIAELNEGHWSWAVESDVGFTIPWLDLDAERLRRYAHGELTDAPGQLEDIYPAGVLANVAGRDVLCLAAGGGQQSAAFGLLGARVTVLDLTEGQLTGDRQAADHYGYDLVTIQGDMRDLSRLADASFDVVYQAESMSWVPDAREVYAGVSRVLRRGGLYRVSFANPATEFVEIESWDGGGYRLSVPYAEREQVEPATPDRAACVQFRHHMGEIFNGCIEAGMEIERVEDDPHYFRSADRLTPGSWDHALRYLGGFAILARKAG